MISVLAAINIPRLIQTFLSIFAAVVWFDLWNNSVSSRIQSSNLSDQNYFEMVLLATVTADTVIRLLCPYIWGEIQMFVSDVRQPARQKIL